MIHYLREYSGNAHIVVKMTFGRISPTHIIQIYFNLDFVLNGWILSYMH